MPGRLDRFSGANRALVAKINQLVDRLNALRITGDGLVLVTENAVGQFTASLNLNALVGRLAYNIPYELIRARTTAHALIAGRYTYSWEEVIKTAAGYDQWTAKPSGRTGANNAYSRAESRSKPICPLPDGTLVLLEVILENGNREYWFDPPPIYTFELDGSPDDDDTASGFYGHGQLAETVAQFQVVYSTAAGTFGKALATNADLRPAVGMAHTGGNTNDWIPIVRLGYVRNDGWNFTPRAPLYLSVDTAGAITEIEPEWATGTRAQEIGYAVTSTIIWVDFIRTRANVVTGPKEVGGESPVPQLDYIPLWAADGERRLAPGLKLVKSVSGGGAGLGDPGVDTSGVTEKAIRDALGAGLFLPLPAGDLSAKGLYGTGTLNEAVSAGDVLAVGGNGKFFKAVNTDLVNFPAVALAITNGGADEAIPILFEGYYRRDAWDWNPEGKEVFVASGAGAITDVKPVAPAQIQCVGHSITADVIYFDPQDVQAAAGGAHQTGAGHVAITESGFFFAPKLFGTITFTLQDRTAGLKAWAMVGGCDTACINWYIEVTDGAQSVYSNNMGMSPSGTFHGAWTFTGDQLVNANIDNGAIAIKLWGAADEAQAGAYGYDGLWIAANGYMPITPC